MKKLRGMICALLMVMLGAVIVYADEGVSQKPDYFTDYYMIVESARGGIDIYSEADYESGKLNDALIPNGTAIRIEGEKTGKDNKDWGYTRYHGMYGYVPFDDLKPVTASEAVQSEYAAFGGTDVDFDVTVKTENGDIALYGGPGEKFGEVTEAGRLADGTAVHISQYVHAEDGKDWGKTSTETGEGWIDLGDTDYVPEEDTVKEGDVPAAASAEAQVTATPTAAPTPAATSVPTSTPTAEPTATEAPTSTPTAEPTATEEPTSTPTEEPTSTPTEEVTPTEETTPTEAVSDKQDEKAQDASAQSVSAESSWVKNPVIWIVLVIIILIVAVVIFFKKKK